MADPAIEIREISKSFGPVKAVDNVSLTIEAGSFFFLLGPSGCGKTTLLRMLAGLETADDGQILFDGKNMESVPAHQRGAPMVFQNYALWPHLSVYDNVAFGLVEQKVERARIRERVQAALAQVDLSGVEKRHPGQLSGGQQQRVVLARALVMEPKVILLDEPLSNLDAKLRNEMRDELQKLHETTPITFVYVTHDQSEALSLADRMAVMHDGRVEAVNAPGALYNTPPNRFCADFLGEANWIDCTVTGSRGSRLLVETAFGEWELQDQHASCREAGTKGQCMIRPEAWMLTLADSSDGLNHLEAKVTQVRLEGATVSVFMKTPSGDLRALLLNRPQLHLQTGQRYNWGAAPENCVFIGSTQ